jgi:hypothetical protein
LFPFLQTRLRIPPEDLPPSKRGKILIPRKIAQ